MPPAARFCKSWSPRRAAAWSGSTRWLSRKPGGRMIDRVAAGMGLSCSRFGHVSCSSCRGAQHRIEQMDEHGMRRNHPCRSSKCCWRLPPAEVCCIAVLVSPFSRCQHWLSARQGHPSAAPRAGCSPWQSRQRPSLLAGMAWAAARPSTCPPRCARPACLPRAVC